MYKLTNEAKSRVMSELGRVAKAQVSLSVVVEEINNKEDKGHYELGGQYTMSGNPYLLLLSDDDFELNKNTSIIID